MDIFQEIQEGPVPGTNQISVERLADVEVTLKSNSNHTVNTSWDKNMIISKLCPGRKFFLYIFWSTSRNIYLYSLKFSIIDIPLPRNVIDNITCECNLGDGENVVVTYCDNIVTICDNMWQYHLWVQFGWLGGCRETQLGQSSGSSGTQAWPVIQNNAMLQ